jgi:uncharacterized tellurite resistance protein B-like protein
VYSASPPLSAEEIRQLDEEDRQATALGTFAVKVFEALDAGHALPLDGSWMFAVIDADARRHVAEAIELRGLLGDILGAYQRRWHESEE